MPNKYLDSDVIANSNNKTDFINMITTDYIKVMFHVLFPFVGHSENM